MLGTLRKPRPVPPATDRSPAQRPAAARVPVLLPYPFPGPFDYAVPPDLALAPGDLDQIMTYLETLR